MIFLSHIKIRHAYDFSLCFPPELLMSFLSFTTDYYVTCGVTCCNVSQLSVYVKIDWYFAHLRPYLLALISHNPKIIGDGSLQYSWLSTMGKNCLKFIHYFIIIFFFQCIYSSINRPFLTKNNYSSKDPLYSFYIKYAVIENRWEKISYSKRFIKQVNPSQRLP